MNDTEIASRSIMFKIGRFCPKFQVSSVKPTGIARIDAPIKIWRMSLNLNLALSKG